MDDLQAFYLMGGCVLASGILTAFISIKGHAGLLCGEDSEQVIAAYKRTGAPAAATTLQVPEPDAEVVEEIE
jgi:hypothetical protein